MGLPPLPVAAKVVPTRVSFSQPIIHMRTAKILEGPQYLTLKLCDLSNAAERAYQYARGRYIYIYQGIQWRSARRPAGPRAASRNAKQANPLRVIDTCGPRPSPGSSCDFGADSNGRSNGAIRETGCVRPRRQPRTELRRRSWLGQARLHRQRGDAISGVKYRGSGSQVSSTMRLANARFHSAEGVTDSMAASRVDGLAPTETQ